MDFSSMALSLNKITFRYRIGFRFSAVVKRKKDYTKQAKPQLLHNLNLLHWEEIAIILTSEL